MAPGFVAPGWLKIFSTSARSRALSCRASALPRQVAWQLALTTSRLSAVMSTGASELAASCAAVPSLSSEAVMKLMADKNLGTFTVAGSVRRQGGGLVAPKVQHIYGTTLGGLPAQVLGGHQEGRLVTQDLAQLMQFAAEVGQRLCFGRVRPEQPGDTLPGLRRSGVRDQEADQGAPVRPGHPEHAPKDLALDWSYHLAYGAGTATTHRIIAGI